MAAARHRSVMLWALAAVAGAHGLVVLWLAAQVAVLSFRARPVADLSSITVTLQPLPGRTSRPRPAERSPARPEPAPPGSPAPSGPTTIEGDAGPGELANLAKPVFLDWPHPTPAGAAWGRESEAASAPRLALSGGWTQCRRKDKAEDEAAWSPSGRVKAPCLDR